MRLLILLLLATAGLFHLASSAQDRGDLRAPPLIEHIGDGPRVRLASAAVTVEPGAGMVRTTLDLTFRNPSSRVLEGRLQFPLHPRQQVVGFALDIDGRMREAVPVEKARGRQVFEAIERRGVDPGLLEQTEGDAFRLRIFPFAPGGERRVRIVVLEPLQRQADGSSMRLPLQFATDLDAIDLTVLSADAPVLEGVLRGPRITTLRDGLHRMRLPRGRLGGDRVLGLRFTAAAGPRVQTQVHGDDTYFVAEVPVGNEAKPRALPARIGLLWDSSMSGAKRAHDLEFALLEAYFKAAGHLEVQLIRLRDVAEPVERHRVVDGDWSTLRTSLEATVYDGASAPGGWVPDASVGEYLLFGDGLFNFGIKPFPAFSASQRLHVIQSGAGDSARLSALAATRDGQHRLVRDRASLAAAAQALLNDTPRVMVDGIGVDQIVRDGNTARDGVVRVAGRMKSADASLRLRVMSNGRTRTIEVPLTDAVDGELAGLLWARYSLAALQADPDAHHAAIESLGRRFGLVTSRTSLLVLEEVADYERYDIAPPAELRVAYDALRSAQTRTQGESRQERLDAVAARWTERAEWWARPFSKKRAPRSERALVIAESVASPQAPGGRPAPAPAIRVASAPVESNRVATAAPDDRQELSRIEVTGSRITAADLESASAAADAPDDLASIAPQDDAPTATIHLQPWRPDSAAARRLRDAPADGVYALYLDERDRERNGTAFYLDVADILFEKQQHVLALRVLSNLAELDLDNRHVLRVLGYRLMQAGRADLAVPVLERVRGMAADEPQSHRDLGLAYQATGRTQRAIDALYEVVQGEWDSRFAEIEVTALAEFNAILATSPTPLETRAFDRRLLRNLPVGLRVVLGWDSDNSDMDLWVTDPHGEKAYYGHRETMQGGRMSDDFTGGYGPEEFVLRDPVPGIYKVEANFFGDRQALVTGATTLQLWLSTGFGTGKQVDRHVTLRLKGQGETVLVGEFEVK